MLRQFINPERHRYRKHCWHCNWDTTDKNHENHINHSTVVPFVCCKCDHNNDNDPKSNVPHTEISNRRQNCLQMPVFFSFRNKIRGLSKKSVDTSSMNHCINFSTFHNGCRIYLITRVLRNRQTFSREAGLVNLQRCTLKNLKISRDDIPKLDRHDIPRYKVLGWNCFPFPIPFCLTVGTQLFHQSGNRVSSLGLFIVANRRVRNQQDHDTDKIGVIGRGVFSRRGWLPCASDQTSVGGKLFGRKKKRLWTIGQNNGHNGSHLHDPREWVPHKGEKLQALVGFNFGQTIMTILLEPACGFLTRYPIPGGIKFQQGFLNG
mmetsp:Transcript_16110/g.27740  ORF Transcript_16110/g.27740 Transcript_16110/m.27740 type:complete len:319 (-) Transcript_16110:356-1312(-)